VEFPASAADEEDFLKTALNQKVDPAPSVLSAPILPANSTTSFLQMETPRPDPPYLRPVAE
jgi:hypothetical protein